MSEEVKPTENVETPETQPTIAAVATPPENVGEKKFTQTDVDKIVNNRLAREKAAYENQLADQKVALEQAHITKETELTKQLTEKENKIRGYEKGIATDKLDEALVLANLKQQKVEGLTLDEALTQVAQEFPNLVSATKSGAPVVNDPKPTNSYWTEEMKRRFPAQWAAVQKNQK